jgi:hypothetical protein
MVVFGLLVLLGMVALGRVILGMVVLGLVQVPPYSLPHLPTVLLFYYYVLVVYIESQTVYIELAQHDFCLGWLRRFDISVNR